PIGLGEVIRSGGLGEVVASRSERYRVGDLVTGITGWQDHVVCGGGRKTLHTVPPGIAPPTALGVLGATGMTAYFGVLEVGALRAGDTVVVSGAAGAVGSVAGQIA